MNLEIVKLDDFGRGITYIDGKTTFVEGTTIGDIVDIKIIKSKKNYNEAKVIKYVKLSNKRVKEECPYFNICGGCSTQNISYEDELNYKKDKVINYFKKNNLDINPSIIYDKPYNYRNKITLKVVNRVIGYYSSNSHKIVPINKCIIALYSINEVIPLLNSINIINGSIIIRSNSKNELLLIIDSLDKLSFSNEVKSKFKGIILNKELIYGEDYLIEEINGITYKVAYDAFFQVNPLAKEIFKIISNRITNNDIVLDAYSGVGVLALSAKNAKLVYGVEIIENAILNARDNAKINGIDNVSFEVKNLEADAIDYNFNTLIVDPPRAGLSKKLINLIKEKQPKKIIYVSCDYHTQVRDILMLDYHIKESYIVDLFPRTYHTECILILEKN